MRERTARLAIRVWWLDLLGLGAACAGWLLIPRWVEFTERFYRTRGSGLLAPPLMGRAFVVVIRAACLLVALFAAVDFVRSVA
jgi:hypothetical protein